MNATPCIVLALVLLHTAVPVLGAPPHRDHADEYASELLDPDNPQRHMAASRLKAVNERQNVPPAVERRLAAWLNQPATDSVTRAEHIGLVASVLAGSHADSPAIGEAIDGLGLVLGRQMLPVARAGAVDALYMISRHTTLPPATIDLIEERAFADPDRGVRIAAMRALIQAGPDDVVKRRLDAELMQQAGLGYQEFAAPGSWDYYSERDHNAVHGLLWSLHEPDVPEAVMAMWVSKLVGGHLHDTALRMLENVVKTSHLPQPIYDQVLAAAERESRAIDADRREKLYRLLQQSRRAQPNAANAAAVDDLALARTLALDPDTGKRLTAGHRLREFANDNRAGRESLELLAGVVETEENWELRDLTVRILGYAAPKEYVEVLHRHFNSGRYDHLSLRIFLSAYGRADWIRNYASDDTLLPQVRSAAIYDYSRAGFEVPRDMISVLQEVARDDAEYEVRQAAGQALGYLDAWVPLLTRLERHENQLQALFVLWLAAVALYLLSVVVGACAMAVRWRAVLRGYSGVGIFGWFAGALVLVPAIAIGALSLFRHNGPTPTTGEMFLTFLPTYVLVVFFGYATLRIVRAGLNASAGQPVSAMR